MMAWFGYCLVTSGLLALAALATERALGHFGRPVRWAWVGAAAGSIVLPFVAFFAPALLEAVRTPVSVTPPLLEGLVPTVISFGVPAPAGGADAGAILSIALMGFWVAAAVAICSYLAVSYGRLRGEMRGWVEGRILNTPVYLSRDRGPAVVGIRDAVIVLPRWIEALEERMLLLVFRHEREHQEAGDQRLLLIGLASILFMPWNPIAWWTVRRLRLAIEFDCDQRVLASGVDAREYAEALLHVGQHVSHPPLAAVALAENRSAVERRLRRFTAPLRRFRGIRAAAAAGVAALLVAQACESPHSTAPPSSLGDATVRAAEQPAADRDPGDRSGQPVFLPYDRPPSLANREVVEATMAAEQARLDASGRVELWLYVTADGEVGNAIVKTSSGEDRTDEAALAVGRAFEFTPARNGDEPTPVWVSQFITFEPPRDEADASATYDAKAAPDQAPEPGVEGAIAEYDAGRYVLDGSSIVSPLDPDVIMVVDGVIQARSRSRAAIETDGREIERIEVIRGEEAVRRYGPRASEGVILVTTKEAAARSAATTLKERSTTGGEVRRLGEQSPVRVVDGQLRVDGESEPLLVIDGVIMDDGTNLSDLDPSTIDRIEVLKGPAAEAAYGERGRHGVVRITTRN